MKLDFEFSDLIGGYVSEFDSEKKLLKLKTSDEREFEVILGANLFGRITRNLGELYMDCTGQIPELLTKGQYVYVYGIFYLTKDKHIIEAKVMDFPGKKQGKFRGEEPDWWVKQIENICNFYLCICQPKSTPSFN